jgi:hypothetical protein
MRKIPADVVIRRVREDPDHLRIALGGWGRSVDDTARRSVFEALLVDRRGMSGNLRHDHVLEFRPDGLFAVSDSRMYDGRVVSAWDTERIVAGGLVMLGGALTISRTLRGLAGQN